MSIRAWDPVAARLVARYRVVRLDFRGQLLSPGKTPADFTGHARDVVGVLDTLGIDRAHLVGTSFGALTALTVGAHFGDRVRSIVAMTATDRVTTEMWQRVEEIRGAARAAIAGGDGRRVFDLLAPTTFSDTYREAHAEDIRTRRELIGRLPLSWYEGIAGLLGALEGFDVAPEAASITAPVIVLAAERDLTFPLVHSQALAEVLPQGRLQVLSEAPHGVAVEEPDVVAAAVLAFLDEFDAGQAG
jgi:pimeloyl-ACP methyl ester carboxylesterase